MPSDYRIRATAAGGLLRGVAVLTTQSAESARRAHQAQPVAAAAMGRLISSAAILGVDLKEGQSRLSVEAQGGGPLGRVVAEIRAGGLLRARVQHPEVDLPLRSDGKLAVGQAVGDGGFLTILRQTMDGDWYQSQVSLKTGEIGEDVLHYLIQSEQVPSAVSVGVLVGTKGEVIGSGGVLVQALPGCPPALADETADRFSRLNQISRRLADGDALQALLADVLPEAIKWYSPEPLRWDCGCNRSSIVRALSTLPSQDLDDLIADGGAEVTCQYCCSAYRFTANELDQMRTGDAR